MDDTIAPIPGQGGRMLRRLAVLVLFSLAGSVAGVEASWYGLHYYPGWFGWLGGNRYYVDEAPPPRCAGCRPSAAQHRYLRSRQLPRGVARDYGRPGRRRAQRRQGQEV